MAAVSKTKAVGAAAVVLLLMGTAAVVTRELVRERPPAPAPVAKLLSTAPVTSSSEEAPVIGVYRHEDPAYAKFPYMDGFPLVVPGSVSGSAVLADLDGDRDPEIVVPVIGRPGDRPHMYEKEIHPSPSLAGQIYAFRRGGTLHPSFPVVIRGLEWRKSKPRLDWNWNFSPSVTDTDRNGTDDIIVGGHVLFGDGVHLTFRDLHDPYGSVALTDMDKDDDLDMLMGWTAQSVRGAPVRGWPRDRSFPPGYSPIVGDADGDGSLEIFHPLNDGRTFAAFDEKLKPLPGWPQPVGQRVMYPMMGDMDGDGKAEVVGVAWNGVLHAWHHDGRPLGACTREGNIDSIFKKGLNAFFSHPAMADLDADGSAEVLVLDWDTYTVRAWKSDGSPAVPHDPSLPDGFLLRVPKQRNSGYGPAGGISVADLGGDGVMDIFVGTTWFKMKEDGKTEQIEMAPGNPQSTTVPTIVDFDGDGEAEIIFGTTDGRLFVYQTRMKYDPARVEWQTQENNFRHSGEWLSRRRR